MKVVGKISSRHPKDNSALTVNPFESTRFWPVVLGTILSYFSMCFNIQGYRKVHF